MTTTPAMPELPRETVIAIGKKHFPKTTLSNAWFGFAADIALATLQAQPAEVSDAELRKTIDALRDPGTVSAFYNGYYTLTPDELRRAILALRPQAVPMTGKQARLLSREELAGCCGGCASNSAIETWMRRAIEKFCEVNGITAPAGGEKQA